MAGEQGDRVVARRCGGVLYDCCSSWPDTRLTDRRPDDMILVQVASDGDGNEG